MTWVNSAHTRMTAGRRRLTEVASCDDVPANQRMGKGCVASGVE